jgi:tRNA modification GTPase
MATSAVSSCFIPSRARSFDSTQLNRPVLGRWGSASGEELVVCRRDDNQVEVHSHGGIAAVKKVIDDLRHHGCEPLRWDTWLRQSIADPIAAEARIALSRATTTRTAGILLQQLNGAFANAIANLLAEVSAANWSIAAERIENLLQHQHLGQHLTTPWRVVFAGPPNVGKSSLINALAGFQRAIVSPIPGTTRDIVTLTTAIDGWPVELADTAGLRSTADPLEAAGVELSQTALAAADLAVLVHDARVAEPATEFEPRELPRRVIHVRNKIDLLPLDRRRAEPEARMSTVVSTSAQRGFGIAQLTAAISHSLVPSPPAAGEAVPFVRPQIDSLMVARRAIQIRDAAAAVEALQSLLSKTAAS